MKEQIYGAQNEDCIVLYYAHYKNFRENILLQKFLRISSSFYIGTALYSVSNPKPDHALCFYNVLTILVDY